MQSLSTQFQKARVVFESLQLGLHPETKEELPKNSIVNDINVNRAIGTAILALDQLQARISRRAQLPESVGKTWEHEEEDRLRAEFKDGKPIPIIATNHGRTVRAIEARLEKIGLLRADQRTTDNSFVAGTKKGGK
jgi:hypothetical protein